VLVAMFDSKTHELTWKGAASADLGGNPDNNIEKLDKSVSKMFQEFPPNWIACD
jgi:Domain of unknown function (DUF4136)